MSDRLFFSLAALAALLMIGLALVWPQGLGRRSPEPFGGPEVAPAYVEANRRKAEAEARAAAERAARQAVAAAARARSQSDDAVDDVDEAALDSAAPEPAAEAAR